MNARSDFDAAELDEVPVLPVARVVAAGTDTREDGTGVLRFTVSLTPALCAGETVGQEGALSLARWPSEVHAALASGTLGHASDGPGRLKIVMRHAREVLNGLCPVPSQFGDVSGLPGATILGSPDLRRQDRAALDAIWQNSLTRSHAPAAQHTADCAPPKDGGWEDLACLLLLSLQGKTTTPGRIAEDGGVAPLDEERDFGAMGQILPTDPPTAAEVDAIVRVPHADLALALDQQKAEELIVSLKAACGESDAHEAQERARIAALAPRPGVSDGPDVLDGLSTDNETAKAELDARIKARKVAEREALRHALEAGNRPAAKDAYMREKERLQDNACTVPEDAPGWSGLTAGSAAEEATREDRIKAACDAHCYATWPQYTHPKDRGARCGEGETAQAPRIVQTYFGIASNPVLARAFGLVVDCELPLSDVLNSVGDDAFVFLGTEFDALFETRCASAGMPVPRTWTLARLHLDEGGTWQFWPVTEAEMHARLLSQNAPPSPTQSDGLLMLSTGSNGEAARHLPRFDLTSIDIRTATETEVQRRQGRQANVDEAAGRVRRGETDAASDEADPLDTDLGIAARTVTGGLTLACRSAQADAAARLARRDVKGGATGGEIVLDADDLTTGLRLAIGVPGADGATDWRPMMSREIEYGTSGPDKGRIEPLLGRMFSGRRRSAWRTALDAGYLVVPSRLLPTGGPGVEAIVEEAIVSWEGDPMGVDCTASGTSPRVADALSFGRTMRLPTDGQRPPPLRFGWPYRVALAPVYSGGASRDPDDFPDDRLVWGARDHFFPRREDDPDRPGARPYFRFLRHEKVLAPQIAMPHAHALRSYTGPASNTRGTRAGPMGFEENRRMLVRSMIGVGREALRADPRLAVRATPAISQRIILPPSMPLDDIIRHGSFDRPRPTRPKGALRHLAASRPHLRDISERESLIVTRTSTEKGINGRNHLRRRTVEAVSNENLASETVSLGGAVYKRASGGESRLTSFFPDPTARMIAIGLKRQGEACFLGGGPILVDVGRDDDDTDILPLVLTVERTDARAAPTTLGEVVARTEGFRRRWFDLDASGDVFEGDNRTELGVDVRLFIGPGEAFEVHAWAVPGPETLAKDFALVQSLGVLLAQKAAPALFCDAEAIQDATLGFLPERVAAKLSAALKTCDPAATSYVAPGGVGAPTNAVLLEIAKALHDELACHPIPELVAPAIVDAVHACNRSAVPPAWPASAPAGQFDADILPPSDAPGPVRAARPASLETDPDAALVVASPGSRHLVLDGEIEIDLNANDTLEIIARTVLPSSSDFDDRNRGRSVAKKRRGTWPTLRDADGEPLGGAEDPTYRTARDIFGFNVARSGQVEHDKSEVVLLRVEGLPTSTTSGKLDLRALFEDRGPGEARVVHRHVFPDGKARILELSLNTISRTASEMRTIDRVAGPNDPWSGGEGLVYREGEQVPGEALEREHLLNRSSLPIVLHLPATTRPAKPDSQAPVPVFAWESGADAAPNRRFKWIKRTATVRIPLRRDWYSNGDGELLGIVTWPPCQVFRTVDRRGHVAIPAAMPGDAEREVDFKYLMPGQGKDIGLEETDIGPGGAYLSRRGGDPVRGLRAPRGSTWGTETRALMGKEDFPDLLRPDGDPRRARFYENVSMPLSDETDTGKEGGAAKLPPLAVGLVAYEPRFDVEREEWFVDVTLSPSAAPDGFVRLGLVRYQPNTIPGLRCSRPDVQWVQVLPERRVSARRSEAGRVEVEIQGRVANDRKLPEGLEPSLSDRVRQPNMRLTLFEEQENASGRARRIVPQREGERETESTFALAEMGATLGTWRTTFDLGQRRDAEGELKLLIEEIEYFRPASYPEEPLEAAATEVWRDRFVEAGPRFSVAIALDDLLPLGRN